MRGIDLVAAVTVLAEIGDLSRFQNPRELMGYLGLVPSESSTGDTVNRGGITKARNGRARRILVEAAWSYRYPPRVSREKQMKVAAAPRAVREIAWKAQMRLCGRFRSLTRKGKRPTVVATAIARELAAFIWAINREVVGSHPCGAAQIAAALGHEPKVSPRVGQRTTVALQPYLREGAAAARKEPLAASPRSMPGSSTRRRESRPRGHVPCNYSSG
jgi:hypothetical protein